MRTASIATSSLLAISSVYALPEISIGKRDAGLQQSPAAKGAVAKKLAKRQSGTLQTTVYDILDYSYGGAYYANITVGTPPQNQVVIVDTGSSDLYLDASSAPACNGPETAYSCRGGTFDRNSSNTLKIVEPAPAFNTSFGDGSTAVGPFATDEVCVGSVCVSNVQFGIAEEVNSTSGFAVGLLGLGYSENEATNTIYPNLPEVLKNAGVISSRLYSVFLNDFAAISGSILFGGIDTSRFSGALATLDFLPSARSGVVDAFITTVTAASVTVGGTSTKLFSGGHNSVQAYQSSDPALPVLLDTGSTAWSVDESIYNQYFAKPFSWVDDQGLCSCSHQNDDTSITLEFGLKVNITIPIREFVVPIYNASTNTAIPYGNNQGDACAFLISPSESTGQGFQPMGDAILRSMYVVFDLDNGQVSLAQASLNSSTRSNVVSVGAGPSGVASALRSASSTVSYLPASTSQTYSIAPYVTGAGSFATSSAATPVGTATGSRAVPFDAQVSVSAMGIVSAAPASAATATASAPSGSASKSSAAATGTVVRGASGVVWVLGVVVCSVLLGGALIL
ncbi:hypothetical protein BAUCODRAFT_99500 [Baudoinia panamericana UAMH 10762]|uniref:Peptidase A1 domain-containing protein n=1 Tax=Baudoinia panamericana (strain UAMH 10762) TaxID=717646 RepID=M2M2T5_BAUPA|nr:uncharacterized protein BAUCODRAFT_99500 [Baudoinia panamericana UAMH 10762]EMC90841.1 hypothetical protein BAUCODRAFT_99500 [Baudoinia panamericana UAMH 10762]